MKISVNGKLTETSESISISDLLGEMKVQPGTVVVQYNGQIAKKEMLSEIFLQENDELEILWFVGGG